ncbi:GerAB/ArcD/ProY family transporter [Paenibacillus arenilitoris]|uniref:Endospore germination permease n=1 Tax=Paenibacillus arenilitoris TaxID=2772299 RepID=A0A927H5W4_9BACL|nr:endospore germination permease [Paenibacillus arenilitoris]MBD2869896.1 endospore germination permease [Paenibacillus arenilitoris]
MTGKVQISLRQFTVLVMFYSIGTTILVIPAALAATAKQNAWIAAFAGWLLSLIITALYVKLGSLFPRRSIVQYAALLTGGWIGKPISLLFIFYSFVGAATVLYYMGNFMTTQVMPETPIEAFIVLFAGLVVFGLRLGLEVLARTAEILFPWFVVLFVVLTIFLLPEIEMKNIRPVAEIAFKPILSGAISYISYSSLPLIVFFMIFPANLNRKREAGKAFLIGTLVGGIFVIIVTFLCISILGADFTERNMFPSYALAKKINIGNFVERVEILIAGIWFMTIFFKTVLYAYGFVAGLAHLFECEDYRPLVLPSGMILAASSLVVYPNVVYMLEFDSTVYVPFSFAIGLALPLLLLLVAGLIRKKRNH